MPPIRFGVDMSVAVNSSLYRGVAHIEPCRIFMSNDDDELGKNCHATPQGGSVDTIDSEEHYPHALTLSPNRVLECLEAA